MADNNSMSSGSFYSGNGASNGFNNYDISSLDPADPRTNGGVVVKASIVYDADSDGDFDNPTSAGGDPASRDEQYNVLLYVGNIDPTEPMAGCNAADLAMPFGVLDFSDVVAFLGAFGAGCP